MISSRDLTFANLLLNNMINFPNKEALVFGEQRLTWSSLGWLVEKLARGLRSIGIQRGDKVVVLLPNCPEFIYCYLAISWLGATAVPASTRFRALEIDYLCCHSGAVCLITVDNYLDYDFLSVVNELKLNLVLKSVVICSKKNFQSDYQQGTYYFEDLLKYRGEREERTDPQCDPKDQALIIYTSGTTGNPKGVTLSYNNLLWDAVGVSSILELTSDDVVLLGSPLSHGSGLCMTFTPALLKASKIILMERFKTEEALELIECERVTMIYGVPTVFNMMINSPTRDTYDLSSLRSGLMSGSSCPAQVVREVIHGLGCNVLVAYGMTEGTIMLINRFGEDEKTRIESVGRPVPFEEICIVDDQQNVVGQGEIGELWVRGKNITNGYYLQPELTAQAINSDGWLFTGDLAWQDERGNISIAGRKKELIIRGGFNIYPSEVEDVLYKHPSVNQAAVIGIPDPKLGEKICACLQLKDGLTVSEADILAFCKARIAQFKIPDEIRFISEFPTTASNKILKRALLEKLGYEV